MLQVWSISKLGKLPWSIRKDVRFYAPLEESLDFYGVDPVAFSRGILSTRVGRDGLTHNIGADVPQFNFYGEYPLGLWWMAAQALSYSPANSLNDANTLIWFEDSTPKSTPTDPNIFDGAGNFGPALNHSYKDIIKLNRVATNAEINEIQFTFGNVVQVIPPPVTPPVAEVGAFYKETPAGVVNSSNTVFTLSQVPNVESIILVAHGVICERVDAAPGAMQFTLSGTGNKTVTMGLAPAPGPAFWASYVIGL